MEVYKKTLVNNLNFSISNIFFKFLNIQLKNDVIRIPNFEFSSASKTPIEIESKIEDSDMNMNIYYINKLKNTFILRDEFLITKAHVTGVVVFCIMKEERWIYGIDDGTEVVNCVQWMYKKDNDTSLAQYLSKGNLKEGKTVSVLAQIEFFGSEIQLNVKSFRILDSLEESYKFYHQTIKTQK